MSAMEIGLFQLENLSMMPARFVFFDIRKDRISVNAYLDGLLRKSAAVAAEQVEEHLHKAQHDKLAPVVLVCEDGKSSHALARRLESAGYSNVYVVTGGVAGLLSEL